jgi:hypothetical protein
MSQQTCTHCQERDAVVLESEYGVDWLCGPCWTLYLAQHYPLTPAFGQALPQHGHGDDRAELLAGDAA